MDKNKKAIILGAGPAGIITGWLLSKRGWKVKILEKQNIVGGMCRSWKWKKYILDTGPHIFHTPDKKLWDFWNKNFGYGTKAHLEGLKKFGITSHHRKGFKPIHKMLSS